MKSTSLRRQIRRNLLTGAAACLAGLLFTLFSLHHSVDGRPFIIAWGAMGLGFVQVAVAVVQLRRLR